MSDITLSPIASGYNLSKINDNFTTVKDVINNETVHTTGGNNIMSQDLGMNSNDILNTNLVETQSLLLGGSVIVPIGSTTTTQAEVQTLTSGQTIVTFVNDTVTASFYIDGDDADNGRLTFPNGYTVNHASKTVTLTQSYPAGTRLTMVYIDGSDLTVLDNAAQVFPTVAALQAASLPAGVSASTQEYSAGIEGGGDFIFYAGDYSTLVAVDIYGGVYVPPSSDLTGASGVFVRQFQEVLNAKWFGMAGDGTNCTARLKSAIAVGELIKKNLLLPWGVYLVNEDIDLKPTCVVYSETKSLGNTKAAPLSLFKGAVIRWDSSGPNPAVAVITSNLDGVGQIANTGIKNIVIDADGVPNAIRLAGWSEQCVCENLEIIQYSGVGFEITGTTLGAVSNFAICENIRLVGLIGSTATKFTDTHTSVFNSIGGDITTGTTGNMSIGMEIYKNCHRNTFTGVHFENVDKPIRIGTFGASNNCLNNKITGIQLGTEDYIPADDTIGSITGKIAIGVYGELKYTIDCMRLIEIAEAGSEGWDYILVDNGRGRTIPGRKSASGLDFLEFCIATGNPYTGSDVWINDAYWVNNTPVIEDIEILFTALSATPSVKGNGRFGSNNGGGATTLTDLLDGEEGQVVEIRARDANTTLKDLGGGGAFYLAGGVDYAMTNGSIIRLRKWSGLWRELSRMVR